MAHGTRLVRVPWQLRAPSHAMVGAALRAVAVRRRAGRPYAGAALRAVAVRRRAGRPYAGAHSGLSRYADAPGTPWSAQHSGLSRYADAPGAPTPAQHSGLSRYADAPGAPTPVRLYSGDSTGVGGEPGVASPRAVAVPQPPVDASTLAKAVDVFVVSVPCSTGHSWSTPEQLVQGAPQGSLWGPSVWRTYIRPLIRRLREVEPSSALSFLRSACCLHASASVKSSIVDVKK